MARVLEVVQAPGFGDLSPGEQDALIEKACLQENYFGPPPPAPK